MSMMGYIDVTLASLLIMRKLGFLRSMVVGVILIVLAGALTPGFSCGPGQAYLAAMRLDLRNLARQQEIYYSDAYSYSADPNLLGFTTSDAITVTITATRHSWAAEARHDALGARSSCSIYYDLVGVLVGAADPPPGFGRRRGQEPGEVACAPVGRRR